MKEIRKSLKRLSKLLDKINRRYNQIKVREHQLSKYLTEKLSVFNPNPRVFSTDDDKISLVISYNEIYFIFRDYSYYEAISKNPDSMLHLLNEAFEYYIDLDTSITRDLENLNRVVKVLKAIIGNR
ncbi:MAG: hypothetical protein DRP27_06360 [Thermotogae bacterium]|nr:MAG: hypothetical protein DRP27_06360 [Thermotogota bacterium]